MWEESESDGLKRGTNYVSSQTLSPNELVEFGWRGARFSGFASQNLLSNAMKHISKKENERKCIPFNKWKYGQYAYNESLWNIFWEGLLPIET